MLDVQGGQHNFWNIQDFKLLIEPQRKATFASEL